jgi:hypothetical protein
MGILGILSGKLKTSFEFCIGGFIFIFWSGKGDKNLSGERLALLSGRNSLFSNTRFFFDLGNHSDGY